MGLMQRYAFNGSSKYCSVNRPGYVTLALLPGITHALQGHVAPGGKEIPVAWRSGQWGRFFPLRAGDPFFGLRRRQPESCPSVRPEALALMSVHAQATKDVEISLMNNAS